MEFKIREQNSVKLAVLEKHFFVKNVQDAVDMLGNADYQGSRKIIVREEQLGEDFFRLATGIAGEILQKFSNYRVQLAIVGNFTKYQSKSLRDFIHESNRGGRIFFVSSMEEAVKALTEGLT